MATWYRIDWNNNIKPVEVVKVTKSFITIRNLYADGTDSRLSIGREFFPSWRDAKDFLIARSVQRIENAEHSLAIHRKELAKFQALVEPEDDHAR
jgi:hypothetical protein